MTDLGTDLREGKSRHIYRYDETTDAKKIIKKKDIKGILRFPTYDRPDMLYTIKPINSLGKKHWRTIGKDENDFFYAYYVRKVDYLPKYAQDRELEVIQKDEPEKSLEDIEDRTASFAGLAACSCGADMIGSLRMDVDNLGKLFSEMGCQKLFPGLARNPFLHAIRVDDACNPCRWNSDICMDLERDRTPSKEVKFRVEREQQLGE